MLEWLEMHQLPCFFRNIFGIACPGCGFQSALLFLFRGEWEASFRSWPALLPLLLFLSMLALRFAGWKKMNDRMLKSVGFFCLITILVSYLLKLLIVDYSAGL